MTKALLIGLATATLVASTVVGTGIANALQASPKSPQASSAEKVGFYWNGHWRPYGAFGPVYGATCPLRKVWVDTRKGPRLRWVRICHRPF